MEFKTQNAFLPLSLLFSGLALIAASLAPETRPTSVNEESGMAALEGRKIIRLSDFAKSSRAPSAEEAPAAGSARGQGPALELPPEISGFGTIMRKSLRTENDLREATRLRRSRPVLQLAFDRLSDYESEIRGREDLVQFIQEALADKQNPEREFVASKIEQIILADNLRPEQNRPQRQELAADKGELVLAYLDVFPSRLEHLLNASAGSPNIQVIRNAIAVGERRRQESLRIIAELNGDVSE